MLKGNDLRYNVYLKKMNKLMRMDIGLDVEAYKDYCNNLKVFAKYNQDYEILANDTLPEGMMNGPLSTAGKSKDGLLLDEETLAKFRTLANEKERLEQMRITVGKLFREYHSPLSYKDRDIIAQFEANPKLFLDSDVMLALDIKRLYDKRKLELEERSRMGTKHIQNVTDKQLEDAGVSKREFELIKKLMKLDPEIFIEKAIFKTSQESPYTFSVDLSKYSDTKVPQELKEILFRPQKLRKLKERYWSIASNLDVKEKQAKKEKYSKRWFPRKLPQGNEEYLLIDKVIAKID